MLLLVALGLLAAYYLFYIANPSTLEEVIDLSSGWSYHTDQNPEPRVLGPSFKVFDVSPGETMYITRLLEEETVDRALLIKNYYQSLTVKIAGEVQLSTQPIPGWETPGVEIHFVPLTDGDQGAVLELCLTSPYWLYSGTPMPVYLGNVRSLTARIVSACVPHLWFLILAAFLGLFFILYSALAILRGKNQWDSLFFGVFSILLGIFAASRDDIVYLFFPPLAASLLPIGLHLVYLIPLAAFLSSFFRTHRRLALGTTILLSVQASIAFLLQWLHVIDFPQMIPVVNVVITVAFLPIVWIILLEFRRNNPLIRFLFPSILLVLFFSACTIFRYFNHRDSAMPDYLLSVFLLVIMVWVYYLHQFSRQRLQEKEEMQALRFRETLAQTSYDNMASRIQSLRRLRHEMGHHIAAIRILHTQGDTTRLSSYLDELTNQFEHTRTQYAQNLLIDCIVADYLVRAGQEDITMEWDVQIAPQVSMADLDLCSLLTNLLDNALDACRLLSSGERRHLHLQIRQSGQLLLLNCKNSCGEVPRPMGGVIPSTKKSAGHGYGIPIMRDIARKYGGELIFEQGEGWFAVKTVLTLTDCSVAEVPVL